MNTQMSFQVLRTANADDEVASGDLSHDSCTTENSQSNCGLRLTDLESSGNYTVKISVSVLGNRLPWIEETYNFSTQDCECSSY